MKSKYKIKKDLIESINLKKKILKSNILNNIFEVSSICVKAISSGGKIIFCGNGGSASDSLHLTTELLIRLNPKINRKPIPALSLNSDPVSMSAHSNDYNYNTYFSRMLQGLGGKNDILIVISTSGNSKNIIEVLKQAKRMKIKSVAF